MLNWLAGWMFARSSCIEFFNSKGLSPTVMLAAATSSLSASSVVLCTNRAFRSFASLMSRYSFLSPLALTGGSRAWNFRIGQIYNSIFTRIFRLSIIQAATTTWRSLVMSIKATALKASSLILQFGSTWWTISWQNMTWVKEASTTVKRQTNHWSTS